MSHKPHHHQHAESHHEESHPHHSEELLTVREVAERLRVDDTTVRRWIKSGVLEAIELPHRNKRCAYRVKRETLNKLLETTAVA